MAPVLLIQRVRSLGMPAVALTDHGNLFGAVEFLREAKAGGIIPIVGLEAYVAPGKRTDWSTSAGGNGGYADRAWVGEDAEMDRGGLLRR